MSVAHIGRKRVRRNGTSLLIRANRRVSQFTYACNTCISSANPTPSPKLASLVGILLFLLERRPLILQILYLHWIRLRIHFEVFDASSQLADCTAGVSMRSTEQHSTVSRSSKPTEKRTGWHTSYSAVLLRCLGFTGQKHTCFSRHLRRPQLLP